MNFQIIINNPYPNKPARYRNWNGHWRQKPFCLFTFNKYIVMKSRLTNIRTFVQFSKGQHVFNIVFNGNKLMAMNSIKASFGVKSLSTLREYKDNGFLIEGTYTHVS